MTTTIHEAAAVMRLAEADPGSAVPVARALARRARRDGAWAAGSVAERALGIAALHVEDTGRALRHLRAAVALGRRCGDDRLVVEARLRLAAVLNVSGRPTDALAEIGAVLESTTGAERARAWAQRGAIELQLDRLDAASDSFDRALPGLRTAGDQMWLKRVLANRGIVRARRLRFVAAEADLLEAMQINQDLGLTLSVAFLEQNLGWLHTVAGDVPRALDRLDRAEEMLRRHGAQVGFLLEDRARLLLSVGVLGEATRAAEEAVAALERERQTVALPDVRLLLARLALLDDDPRQAVVHAQRASRELLRLGRPESAAVARLLVAAGRVHDPARIRLPALRKVADDLESTGWHGDAIQARLLVARIEAERRTGDRGRSQLARASRSRRRGPAEVRALAWQAEARLRLSRGNPAGALAAARAGLRVLDEQRAALGDIELRTHTARSRGVLAELGLRVALDGRSPSTVLTWAEHGRASQFLLPPVLPPEDEQLAADLAQLRVTAQELDTARAAGRDPSQVLHRLAALERQVRERSRRRPRTGPDGGAAVRRPATVAELSATLADAALVEYVHVGAQLSAVVVVQGSAALVPLGPAGDIPGLGDRLAFALTRMATGRGAAGGLRRLLDDAADRLHRIVLAPLDRYLADRPLVVVPSGPLQSLPWGALPACRGREVTVAPSATAWYAASQPRQSSGLVVVVAGPGLPGALAEAEAVAALHRTEPVSGPAAAVAPVIGMLGGADVAHLATHGQLHPGNPLLSSLLLADGPLTGYDLERLDPMPGLAVLAGCDTGRHTVHPGDELLGLTAALLARGARQVVASVIPVGDAETAPLMTAFHRELLQGRSAAAALARARELQADNPAAAGFVCVGGRFHLARQ